MRIARRTESPPLDQPRPDLSAPVDVPPPQTDQDVAGLLREAAPVAATALGVIGLWPRFRRWIVACAGVLLGLCILACAALFIFVAFIRSN
jgi:hypothetical protein